MTYLSRLELRSLRNIHSMLLELSPNINIFVGSNGAGKSTICEALSLLLHGRSFRAQAGLRHLLPLGHTEFAINAQFYGSAITTVKMRRSSVSGWQVTCDDLAAKQLQTVTKILPLKLLVAEEHSLVDGDPNQRRQFLDWLMFHVEPNYNLWMRQYQRVLAQRNSALRQKNRFDDELAAWTEQLGQYGDLIELARIQIVQNLQIFFKNMPKSTYFANISLNLKSNWQGSLAETLISTRHTELQRKMTLHGPHRSDISFNDCKRGLVRHSFSRGEKKIISVLAQLSSVQLLRELYDKRSLIVIDDWQSELDRTTQSELFDRLIGPEQQVVLTATSDLHYGTQADSKVFHVEQGRLIAK